MGIRQLHQKAGVKNMRVEAYLPTNPEKGRANKRKINMQSIQGYVDR